MVTNLSHHVVYVRSFKHFDLTAPFRRMSQERCTVLQHGPHGERQSRSLEISAAGRSKHTSRIPWGRVLAVTCCPGVAEKSLQEEDLVNVSVANHASSEVCGGRLVCRVPPHLGKTLGAERVSGASPENRRIAMTCSATDSFETAAARGCFQVAFCVD
jgi:hypothetical protein